MCLRQPTRPRLGPFDGIDESVAMSRDQQAR
jgi:hypothetical protein